jgi:tetratricopeptide (TPR) repeat protein
MASVLKPFAFRLWVTILLGGLTILWALPAFQASIGLGWTLVPVSGILVLVFIAVGWFFNRLGLYFIERLIREATAWERDSMHYEADKAFRKAVAVFDSFLLSPIVEKRQSPHITAHLARFYLVRADKDDTSENFVCSYLQSHPEDEEVAENWLQQLANQDGLKKEHYEVAIRIGNARPKNKMIQLLLAQFYLDEERTDFQALQTYRRVLSGDPNGAQVVVGQLAAIFLGEGRADEWALRIYIQALELNRDQTQLLKGIAAGAFWIPETERTRPLLHKAIKLLADLDADRLKTMRAGFNPPVLLAIEEKPARAIRLGSTMGRIISLMANTLFRVITSAFKVFMAGSRDLIHFIIRSKRSKIILMRITVAGLTIGLVILVTNTFEHLIKTDTAATENDQLASIPVITDRFTIQVAAYLKSEHAEKYVKHLKKQGLDVFWTEAKGAKKKWYQVRISHFPDKASARAYGESLKAKGIIDDFYIANYDPPQDLLNK